MKLSNGSLQRQNACTRNPERICLYPKVLTTVTRKSQTQSEYGQLREVIPTISNRCDTTKRQVVTEATQYIDELHSELVSKLRQDGEMNDFEVKLNNVNRMVLNLMGNIFSGSPTGSKSPLKEKRKKVKKQCYQT